MADFLEKLSSFSDALMRGNPPNPIGRIQTIDLPPVGDSAKAEPVYAPSLAPTVAAPAPVVPDPGQKLAQDLRLIDAALSNPDTMALVNLSRERGNELTRDNQILLDRQNLTPPAFLAKYGDDVYQKVSVLDSGRNHLQDLQEGQRHPVEWLADQAGNISSGVVQSVGGLAAFGLSTVNKNAAVSMAEGLKQAKELGESQQSRPLQQRRFVDALRTQLDRQDNQAAFEQDKKDSGELVASLRSFGRGLLSGAKRLYEDPTMLETGISESVGSLVVGGPVSRLATTAAGKAVSAAGGRAAEEAISKAAFPLTIGAMEAGGALADTINEVMGISHETLMKNSSAYQALRSQGLSERDAKVELATQAGNVAMAVTFPVAALSGTLVAKFEGAPLAAGITSSPRQMAGNMVREAVEEGIQSGTGAAGGNVGQRLTVDPNKNLAEGVGDQAIQGAIMGAGSAGVTQTPGLAAQGAAAAGKAAIEAVVGTVKDRADAVRAANEASSPVSTETVAAEIRQVAEVAPTIAEAVRSVASEPDFSAEQKVAVEGIATQIETAFTVSETDVQRLDPEIRQASVDAFGETPNRFDLMTMAALATANEAAPQKQRTNAALWLLDQKAKTDEFITSGKDVLGQLDHERPEVKSLEQFTRVLEAMAETPALREALRWAEEKLAAPKIEETSDLTAPENQAIVQTTAEIARLSPEKIDLPSIDIILRQDRERSFLAPEQRQVMHSAAALIQAADALAEAEGLAPTPENRIAIVNRQIETTGGSGAHQKSLSQHVTEIKAALQAGDQNLAKRRVQHLAMFARSMRNKLDAMNQAIQNGDRKRVPYQALGPKGWLPKDGQQSIYYNPGTKSSRALAFQIQAETTAAIQLANSFAAEYPNFGISEITVPTLVVENAPAERGSSSATKAQIESQATTSEIDPDPSQIELPLSNPEPKQPAEAPQAAPDAAPNPVSQEVSQEEQVVEAAVQTPATAPVEALPKMDAPKSEVKASDPVRAADQAVGVSSNTASNLGPVQTQKTNDRFPNLVQPGGKNVFHQVFRLAREQASRLLEDENPLVAAVQRLSKPSELRNRAQMTLNQTQIQAMEDLLRSYVDKAYDAMNTRLQSVPDLLELLKKDEAPNRFVRGKALNIIEPRDDGFAYNEQLQQAALLAGADWLLNASTTQTNLDRDELASSLGVSFVTSEMLAAFNRGVSVEHARDQLAKKIVAFWGLELDRNADKAYADGVAQAVAIEVLASFKDVGLIAHENVKFTLTGDKTFGRIYLDNRSDNLKKIIGNIGPARTLFSRLALVNPVPEGVSIGSPIQDVSQTQLRNPGVQTTRQQRQALEKEQKVRYLPNRSMFDLVSAIGEDGLVELFVGRTDTKGLNANHARSVDGKIRGLRLAFQNVQNQMQEVETHAKQNGLAVEEVPSFYQHEITRVGRMQMLGATNPQSDKLAREIFMPTRSVLNLTEPKHQNFFWLTVAQGLGIKTEQNSRDVSRQKAEEKVSGQYATVISELKSWLKARNDGAKASLPKTIVEMIRTAAGKDLSMHLLHSLLSVAQFQLAQETGADLTRFTHFNYLEADGKTNGPINALMLLSTGAFTSSWLKAVAKGGVFFNQPGKTLNAHFVQDSADLYKQAADQHKVEMADLRARLQGNQLVSDQMDALLRLLSTLNADISFTEDGSLEIKRGVTKNPLTITIYGSGVDGIAGKVAGELVEFIYEKISDFIEAQKADGTLTFEQQTYDRFWQDLSVLTEKQAVFNKETGGYEIEPGAKARRGTTEGDLAKLRTPEGFTLLGHQFETLKTNIRTLFVDPLSKAIDKTVIGHVGGTTSTIQQATQIQSIVMQALFRRGIIEALANKQLNDPNFKAGDFLSEKELQGILNKTLTMGPAFSTGTQSYFLGGTEQGNILGNVNAEGKQETIHLTLGGRAVKIRIPDYFARGLKDDFSAAPLIYGPSLAGVKAVPSLVIGSGDGQMMLNAAVNEKIESVLKVFDGMNMPADKIEDYSREINAAVHQSWIVNPVKALAKSFRDFLDNDPLGQVWNQDDEINAQTKILNEVVLELSKTFTGNPKPKELVSREGAELLLQELAERLDLIAAQIDARQAVFKAFPMSVDQMASGETPYQHEGTVKIGDNFSEAELLDRMNQVYESALTLEKTTPKVAQDQVDQNKEDQSQVTIDQVQKVSPEIRVIEAKALPALYGEFSGLNNNQKEVLSAALKSLAQGEYRVVIGNRAEVETWLQENNGDRYQTDQLDAANGFVDPVSKILVVANQGTSESTETTLHELIHAATFQKMASFYTNPNSVSDVERVAIENIEGMMYEWLRQDFSKESDDAQAAHRLAANAVRSNLDKAVRMEGQTGYETGSNVFRAAAVNEFMAWVLANKHLAKIASQTSVKNSLWTIVGDTLREIRNLIWGRKRSEPKTPKAGEDMLSQLRFNTRILMALPTVEEGLIQDASAIALYQSRAFGQSDRLSDLRQKFLEKVTLWVSDTDPVQTFTRKSQVRNQVYKDAAEISRAFADQGFLPTMQEVTTFNEIVAALTVDAELNPNSLSRIQDIYDHVISELKVEDFLTGSGDPMVDRAQAQNKFDALHGLFVTKIDQKGRSSLMPAFLALAMVDEGFRDILVRIKLPEKSNGQNPRTLDQRLEDLGTASMDHLNQVMSGEGRRSANDSVRELLDRLVQSLLENTGDTRSFIEQTTENGIERIEGKVADYIQNASDALSVKSSQIIGNNPNRIIRAGARLVNVAANLVNEKGSEAIAQGLVSRLNRVNGLHTIRELVNDVVGRLPGSIFDRITEVRSAVQQTRQQFREYLPKTIAREFTRKLTNQEWTGLYRGLAKTDLAALQGAYGLPGSLEFLTDGAKLSNEITVLETQLQTLDPKRAARIQQKAAQLAHHMLTGEHGSNLLRNAYAVARLAGQGGFAVNQVDEGLVDVVDRLVTLYAVRDLEPNTKTVLSTLLQDEQAGVSFAFSYLLGLNRTERDKSSAPIPRLNAYKGHIPSETQQGVSLIVVRDSEHARLMALGYTRIGPYTGSSADRNLGRRSYYFSPVSGRAAYNQGVMQTVHMTAGGVDPGTGYTVGELTAGRITDPQIVAAINRQLPNQRQTTENLLPVFGVNGQVVAFERGIDPAQMTRLDRDTDLSRMIGVWAGRQVEEELAKSSNERLIDDLHTIWLEGKKAGRTAEFINLSSLTKNDDAVLHEAWRLMPQHVRDAIGATFGKDGFRVRRDMLNDAVGYRSATVGDLFTGEGRWKPNIEKALQDIAFTMFGNKAYPNAVAIERAVQDLVVNAKMLIVVKSVVVPAANLMSNVLQLLNRGIPVRNILKGLSGKTAELNEYIKRRHQEIDLEAQLQAAKGLNDLTAIRKLTSRIQTIKDSYRRLSIWPLIEAGEFSAISNGAVTAEDLALAEGKWGEWAERFSSKLPDNGLRTAWRYGMVTRDTALFQGLGKAVQYGDFLGKAVLYDDLVNRRGLSQKEALAQVNEAFVNYNRLAGRSRQYLESIGLLWFYNFKLRSMKEAVYMLRHHPLRSLFLMNMTPKLPVIGNIGSPLTDNFLGIMADGKLSYSVGPGMGLNSFSLNPWVNLVK